MSGKFSGLDTSKLIFDGSTSVKIFMDDFLMQSAIIGWTDEEQLKFLPLFCLKFFNLAKFKRRFKCSLERHSAIECNCWRGI